MQDATDPVVTDNPADTMGDVQVEGGDDPKEMQAPSLSDIFFNGGRGSLDLKMTKSEHNPRKFSRRIAQTPDKKAPHRTSSTGVQKLTVNNLNVNVNVNMTSSKSGGIPVTSDHGNLRSYRRSNSFSRRRSHHPDKRKNAHDADNSRLRASEGAAPAPAPDSEELTMKATLNPTVTVSRRRTGVPAVSAHRRARTSRADAESRQSHSSQQEHSKKTPKADAADKCEDEAGSSNNRTETDSKEFTVQVQRADSSASTDHSTISDSGQDVESAETGQGNQEGKPRSLSFEQKAAPHKQMSRGDSNSSADNGAAKAHRSSHSTERRRHRRATEARLHTNSETNGTTTSPSTPSNDQDLSKRTRTTRHGTSQSSWTRNLRRMKKSSEEDEGALTNSSSAHNKVQNEEGPAHLSKLENDSKKSSLLHEDTNSQRHRRRDLDDHRDSKASEDDKKSSHLLQDQDPISSSRKSPVPSTPRKVSTPRRNHSKSVTKDTGGNLPFDDTRSPPLSQFLDSLLVGNKDNVIVEDSALSTETTTSEQPPTTTQVNLFAVHDPTNTLEPTNQLVGGPAQPSTNDPNMDNHHGSSKGEIHLSANENPTTETDSFVVTKNQGFDHAKSPTRDLQFHNFEESGAREGVAGATLNNKEGRVLQRSPAEKACIAEQNTKVPSAANPGNKSMTFPAINSILPKTALFSPGGRASSLFFDKDTMDQGIKKLANLNLSVTSHGRKKKGLNKFLTTTMKFNKLADGGDSVCLEDLPFSKESADTTRQENAKSSHLPLDKMFMKSNKEYDDTLNDSGGLSFSMDLAGSEPKSQNKLFSLSSQPSRRGLFAKKPKKFQTFDDSGVISFSMDDTNLPKQTWHEVKKEPSLDLRENEVSSDDGALGMGAFGAGFDLVAHITSSRRDSPSQDNTTTLDSHESYAQPNPGGDTGGSEDLAWEFPTAADKGKLNVQSTRSKPAELFDPSISQSRKDSVEDRGSKLQDLLEQPGHRKNAQLAEPSICGTLAEGGPTHGKEALSFTAKGFLDHADHGRGGLLCEDDENLSTASSSSEKDIANPSPDAHRGVQLKDVLNDAAINPTPSDASVCDQSVMTLEQQQHFLQLNLPGMVGYKSSSSLSVFEHAVEVLGAGAPRNSK